MKKIIIILSAIILVGLPMQAQSHLQPYLDSARTAYTSGDFVNATRLYLRIIEHGYESPMIYYNVGNGYYKQMQIANAILWYQRALKLDPSFEDARHNLKMAQELIVDKIEPIALPFYKRWYKSLVIRLSPNFWAYLSVVLFLVFIAALFVIFSSLGDGLKRISIPLGLLALFLSITTFFVANSAHSYAVDRTLGVITAPSVTIRSTPHSEGTKLFTLHEGLTVSISTLVEGWYEIRLDDGRVGWIQEKDIEEV